MNEIDIYNLPKRYKKAIERFEESLISQNNKKLIKEFLNDQSATQVGVQRRIKLINCLRFIALQMNIELDKITEQNIKTYDHKLEDLYKSAHTRSDYRKILKQFLRWSNGKNITDVKFDFLYSRVKTKDKHTVKKAQIITEEDISVLLESCVNARDKALLALAWDTGARVGELGALRVGDITFEKHGIIVDFTKSKTAPRSPWLMMSTQYLMGWLRLHPYRDDPSAPLWPVMVVDDEYINYKKFSRRPLAYHGYYTIFKRLFIRAKMNKPFNPHMFRHSRATWAAQNDWNNQIANKFFGWTQGSDMFDQYVTLVGEDVTNKMKSSYGIKNDIDDARKKREAQTCVRCEQINPSDNKFCYKCGNTMSAQATQELQNVKRKEKEFSQELFQKDLNKNENNGLNMKEIMLEAIKNDPNLILKLAEILK